MFTTVLYFIRQLWNKKEKGRKKKVRKEKEVRRVGSNFLLAFLFGGH